MKNRLVLFTMVMLLGIKGFAQMPSQHATPPPTKVSLTIFGGYTFQDRVDFSNAYGYIRANAHYGGSLEFFFNRMRALELVYQRMDTKAPAYSGYTGLQLNPENEKAALNYIMIGGVNYIPVNPMIKPYGGLDLGVCVITNKNDYTATKFAVGGKLGVKIQAAEHVGIKLQAQLLSVVQGVGGGFYVGTGGASYGMSTYSTVLQFGFTGGLAFDF